MLQRVGFSPWVSPPMCSPGAGWGPAGSPGASLLGFGGNDLFSRNASPSSSLFSPSPFGQGDQGLQLLGMLLAALAPQLAQMLAGLNARNAGNLGSNAFSGNPSPASWAPSAAPAQRRARRSAAPEPEPDPGATPSAPDPKADPQATAPDPAALRAPDPSRSDRNLHVDVPWISQFDRRVPGAGSDACYRATATMARQAGVNVPPGTQNRIQVATGEDGLGRVRTSPERTQAARNYIDQQLAQGRPVVVGVSHKQAHYNADGITDHFVLVNGRGVDEQGRTYYTFHDPATTNRSVGDNSARNRLYVDPQTGNLVKNGAPARGYVVDRRYEMSMVVRTD